MSVDLGMYVYLHYGYLFDSFTLDYGFLSSLNIRHVWIASIPQRFSSNKISNTLWQHGGQQIQDHISLRLSTA